MNDMEFYSELEKHLLEDERPSTYLNKIYNEPVFRQYPFEMLYKLRQTMQSPTHHPEGNVWNHTIMVVDEAAKRKRESKAPKVFMWAALLHDIGKPDTTRERKGRITAYDHDRVGAELAKDFFLHFIDDKIFISEVCELVRYHMQILYVVKGLQFADIKNMKRKTDINEVALLGLCDRLGRLNSDLRLEQKTIKQFLQACNK